MPQETKYYKFMKKQLLFCCNMSASIYWIYSNEFCLFPIFSEKNKTENNLVYISTYICGRWDVIGGHVLKVIYLHSLVQAYLISYEYFNLEFSVIVKSRLKKNYILSGNTFVNIYKTLYRIIYLIRMWILRASRNLYFGWFRKLDLKNRT